MVNCRRCGNELRDDSRFCGQCGTAAGSNCAVCGATTGRADQFCSHCGTRLAVRGNQTGSAAGKPSGKVHPPKPAAPARKIGRSAGIWGILATLLVAGAVMAIRRDAMQRSLNERALRSWINSTRVTPPPRTRQSPPRTETPTEVAPGGSPWRRGQ